MRAVIFDGQTVRVVEDAPAPVAANGEALIRPTLLTIGPSDIAVASGATSFQGTMGHLFVGMVDVVESKSHEHLVGQRVVGSVNVVRSDAPLARKGLGQHAPDRQVLGLHERNGCFADCFTLPAANLVAVPADISDDQAVLTSLVAEALHASRITRIEGKPFVTIIGDGVVALLCAQIMTTMNASVRLLGEQPERFGLCEKWGVKHRAISDVGLRHDQDIVIETTGTATGIERAFGMVRPRGRVVLKQEVIPTPSSHAGAQGPALMPIVMNELEVVGARCGTPSEALAYMAHQPVDVYSLVSRRMHLRDAREAIAVAASPTGLCVLLEP